MSVKSFLHILQLQWLCWFNENEAVNKGLMIIIISWGQSSDSKITRKSLSRWYCQKQWWQQRWWWYPRYGWQWCKKTSHHCQETWKLRCRESATALGPFNKMLLSFILANTILFNPVYQIHFYLFTHPSWATYLFFELLPFHCSKCVCLQNDTQIIFVIYVGHRYYLGNDRNYVDLRVKSQHNFNVKWPVMHNQSLHFIKFGDCGYMEVSVLI